MCKISTATQNHTQESDLKSKSKSLVQKDQTQNHKDIMQLLQDNVYVQKFSKIMPLCNVQKMHTGSVTCFRWLYVV